MVGEIPVKFGTVTLYGSTPTDHLCVAYVPQRKAIDWRFPVTVTDVVMMGRVRKIGLFCHPGRRDRDLVRDSLNGLTSHQSWPTNRRRTVRRPAATRLHCAALATVKPNVVARRAVDRPRHAQSGTVSSICSTPSADSGVTTIIATHDLNLAARTVRSGMLLNTHLVAIGAPEQVLFAENLAAA